MAGVGQWDMYFDIVFIPASSLPVCGVGVVLCNDKLGLLSIPDAATGVIRCWEGYNTRFRE